MQLVLMSLQPGEYIGEEIHDDVDQFFRVEKGKGEVFIDGRTTKVESDTAIIVPAGARHNIRNSMRTARCGSRRRMRRHQASTSRA